MVFLTSLVGPAEGTNTNHDPDHSLVLVHCGCMKNDKKVHDRAQSRRSVGEDEQHTQLKRLS